MAKSEKYHQILSLAQQVLEVDSPMTVRQIYYRCVANQIIDNNRSEYQMVSKVLVDARLNEDIEWEKIEDRLRKPRKPSYWDDLKDYAVTIRRAYHRDIWPTQERYVEVWLEKDALSGIFEDVVHKYGITLNVGRGYDGWDSIHNASERYAEMLEDDKETTILYFGDFDPSGEDMVRSLEDRLNRLDVFPTIRKCALTMEDITKYNLPPDMTKRTDSRRDAFVAKNGDVSVELDAMTPSMLRTRLVGEIEGILDMEAYQTIRDTEKTEKEAIFKLLTGFGEAQ